MKYCKERRSLTTLRFGRMRPQEEYLPQNLGGGLNFPFADLLSGKIEENYVRALLHSF